MCWSAEVAGTFFALQLCTFTYLLYRRQHYDKWYAVALLPVMLQEFSQMMLWIYVGDNKDTCPSMNKFWTFFAAANWRAVTTTFFTVAYSWVNVWWRKVALGILTCVGLVGYIVNVWIVRLWVVEHFCSFPGKCHHLIWGPDTSTQLFPKWVTVMYYVTYLGPLMLLLPLAKAEDGRPWPCFKTSTKGYLAGSGIFAIGVGTLVPTYSYFNILHKDACSPEEWSSVW